MIDGLRLELVDVGPIGYAIIDINRINVIGGRNATGKSTASKLLYCFLKANSNMNYIIRPVLDDKVLKFKNTLQYFMDNEEDIATDLLVSTSLFYQCDWGDDYGNLVNNFKSLESLFNEFKTIVLNKYPEKSSYSQFKRLDNDFESIKEIVNGVNEKSAYFFQESMIKFINSELETRRGYFRFNKARLYDSLKSKFSFEVDFLEESCDVKGKFNVPNVFYLESFSIFDHFVQSSSSPVNEDIAPTHVCELKNSLFLTGRFPMRYNDKSIKKLEKMVADIVGGEILKVDSLRFHPLKSNYDLSMKNTASGIKQIAVIQTLLHNRFLYDGCVLIIDEPEVNLHPEWQIKLARILVLLAKEGNITIYINTHSPMFIEAMDTFVEYYDFEEYSNYYLTGFEDNIEVSNLGRVLTSEFKKVPSDELYKIYDNLGNPYDYLDFVRLSKGRGERIDDIDF